MICRPQKWWTSFTSVNLLGARRSVPRDATYNETRESLRSPLTRGLKNDPEQWWIAKCKEMENATAISNSIKLSMSIDPLIQLKKT